MDFNLKQWREQQQHESDQDHEQITHCAKLPRLHLDSFDPQHQQQQQPPSAPAAASSALPLFVTEPTSICKLSSNMSAAHPPLNTTKYPSSYFSLAQWQELELQALIFRHMLAGAAVPPELLHLVKKSLLNSSPHHSYYLPLHHYPPHFQPALLQSGYWGRSSMDPEPGRCRRTDGKKWRCSRDVVAGLKYCERHMHRGRNRSRKPVEIPTTRTATIPHPHGNGAQHLGAVATGGKPHFTFSGSAPSIDLLHHNQRQSEPVVDSQNDVHGDDKSSGQRLRHFFDDWPRSLQESENGGSNARSMSSATNLSMAISASSNPTSDFSLKLSTGDGDKTGWGANQVASMGGPLAEALRSSTSNSSPTSVLHQLQRGSASETSHVST